MFDILGNEIMANSAEIHETKDTFDLMDLFQQIKKYFWVLILAMIVFGGIGYLCSVFFMEPMYESAITMIVNTKQDNTAVVTNDNITSAQNLVSTYSVIVKSNTVLNQVIADLDLDMNYKDMENNVYVNAVDDTQIMRIAVRDSDRKLSAKIVNKIAEIAPDIIVETVEAGSCKVISQVMTGDDPVTPNVPKNVLLASAAGLMFAIIFITLFTLFKEKKILDDNDIQKYIDLPVLGVIPEVEERS